MAITDTSQPKHIGYNRYGIRLMEHNGSIYPYLPERFAKILGGKYPDDMLKVWSKTIYDYPYEVKGNVRTERFIFRSHKGYSLELCIDLPDNGFNSPILFHIFGGGWTDGTPDRVEVISKYFATKGVAGVRVGYSLSTHPNATMERAFEDIAYAKEVIFKRAKEYNIDTTRFGYMGGSAGAHLSAVAAFNTPGTKVLVGFAGVYDYNMFGRSDKPYFAPNTSEHKLKVSPAYMQPISKPAVFIAHGTGDNLVGYVQSVNFAQHTAKLGLETELHLYPYYWHAFNHPGVTDMFPKLMDEVYNFLSLHL